tara:strand:- start:463 stop:1593 length:1131 start_codon:yes stop_codon:yes gene_type:complete
MIAIALMGTTINSGTKTYSINFLNQINNKSFEEKILVFITKSYLSEEKEFSNKNIKYIIKSSILNNNFIRLLWMQFILPFELKYYGVKTFFSPMNYAPLSLRFIKIKSVLAVHSVLPWSYFNFLPGSFIKKLLIKKIMELSIFNADKIIVPSYYAKQKIIEKLNIHKDKISIVNLGADHIFGKFNNNPLIKDFNYEKKYFLSILSCVKYHNILNLLAAFKKFKDELKSDIKFVIVLSILDKDYYKKIDLFIKENFEKNEVKILENLENKYMRNLYKKSSLYIFTSYSEVFGFTTLEALSFNIPILVSDTSALKEINGNMAEYFDPDDINDIKTKMININLKVKNSKNLNFERNQLLKKYLWEENASKTFKIIKSLD